MENLTELQGLLRQPSTVTLIGHRNPDGDAMGSTLALKNVLEKINHRVYVIMPSDYPANYSWMTGADTISIYDEEPEEVEKIIEKSDLIFFLDFNSLDRIDKVGALTQFSKASKVMIDHHMDPEPIADFVLSKESASSTCELIYDFFEMMGWLEYISEEVASCLYCGILTDTGSFKHATNPRIFEICADLKRRGLDDYAINDKIYNCLQENQLRLLGHCLYNRMEIIPELSTGIIYLTREDYATFDIKRGDTEGIVNYLLTLKDVDLAAFITEQPKIVKISMRSKYDINVQKIAREHFNGGGHKNASGGYTYKPLDVTIENFKKIISEYLPQKVVPMIKPDSKASV